MYQSYKAKYFWGNILSTNLNGFDFVNFCGKIGFIEAAMISLSVNVAQN